MDVNFEILTVAHMHGVTEAVTIAQTLDASGKVAVDQQTGLVLDALIKDFATVAAPSVTITDPTAAKCHAEALKVVQSALGSSYTLNSTPLAMSDLHIWVPREGWVPIPGEEGYSFAFQLQVSTATGPVDQKSIFYVNGAVLTVDILVVVQTP